MKEKLNKKPLYLAGSFLLLFLAIAVLIFMFMNRNSERIVDQNERYLESSAANMSRYIDEHFDNSEKSIKILSNLYEMQLTAPEFDYHLLNEMTEHTPFDYIRFVGTDGISWSGDGRHIDCKDREYYVNGIKGESGICYIASSRFNTEPLFIFYTPLYYQNELIGVINGVIETDHFAEKIDMELFGRSSAPCICLPDGTVISADPTDEYTIFKDDKLLSNVLDVAVSSIEENDPHTFRFQSGGSEIVAYASPVANGSFAMVLTFPNSVRQELIDRANLETLSFEVAFILLFLAYVSSILAYYIIHTRRLKREKKDLSQIVDTIKKLYTRFVIFDLENDSYEYLETGDIASIGIPPTGKYSDWLNGLNYDISLHPQYMSQLEGMSADALRATLTKEKWYSYREYPTPGGRWERLTLMKLDLKSDITNKVLGAVEDITDSKLRDEKKRQALETAFHAAESACNAKSEFLSRMSHDIRTPMNAIIGLTTIMETNIDNKEKVIDSLRKMTSAGKHLLSLINEILDMSKIESGKLVLTEEEFSLAGMMDELMQIIQPTVDDKGQELTVNVSELLHEEVLGDSLRLQQICVNILSNAVKYTPEGGHIVMTISEKFNAQSQMSDYTFVFEDNGIGMTKEFLERLFKPFERAEDERIGSTQGTGLGMSIAQSMVRLMGGTISVDSEPGKGSKFTVNLKLRPKIVDHKHEVKLEGLPILVVDDERVICESVCLMLSELKMNGEWVTSGKEAVKLAKERKAEGKPFFAVLLDRKMPGFDGIQTAKALRSEVCEDMPMIMLSAYDWSDIEDEANAAGVHSFIPKPAFKSRLKKLFTDLVEKSEHEHEAAEQEELDYTGKRVLLIEDNELNQEIAKEILEMTGLSVEIADNGKKGLECFEASEKGYFDIIFMDIQMPVMNGYESAKAIRALSREDAAKIPIVALSANTFTDDIQASLDSGMNHHIGKPINIAELNSVLQKYIG